MSDYGKRERGVSDAGIVGSNGFIEEVIAQAEIRKKGTLSLFGKAATIAEVARAIMEAEGNKKTSCGRRAGPGRWQKHGMYCVNWR